MNLRDGHPTWPNIPSSSRRDPARSVSLIFGAEPAATDLLRLHDSLVFTPGLIYPSSAVLPSACNPYFTPLPTTLTAVRRKYPSAGTRRAHLLLLETPVRQLNLVRKQITPRHGVPQPELTSQRTEAVLGRPVPRASLGLRRNLDDKVVICIASKSGCQLDSL